jgi:prepilin-type N-terminal cleavage/methylation domain-containing protein
VRHTDSGFTLIETLVASAVLVIFFLATALILQNGIEAIGTARLRGEAIRIAQERLELVRNLAYEQVGTMGGIPQGPLLPIETITQNQVEFVVKTSVIYMDDAYDDVAPTDIFPADYKRVKVTVDWSGIFASKQPVVLLTDVSPKTQEMDENQGTLSLTVFDSLGQPITGAEITITAESIEPPISITVNTDVSGKVMLPGAPICDSCYQLSVTKEGYSTERTYGMDEVANPVKPHLSVLEGQITDTSFVIDQLSTLQLTVTRGQAHNYAPFTGASIILRGTKEIGRTVTDDPVYKVERTVVSGLNGVVSVTDLEWDTYDIVMPLGSSVDFAGSWPLTPFSVEPHTTTQVSMIIKSASPHSLLIQATNAQKEPFTEGLVEISRLGFIATASFGLPTKGDRSQAFFSSLVSAQYDVKIEVAQMATLSSSILVSGDRIDYFILEPENEAE